MPIEYIRSKMILAVPCLLMLGMFNDHSQAKTGVNIAAPSKVDSSFITSLAESGRSSAQLLLGEMHLTGHGVQKDHVEALKWFRAAAEQGDAEALRKLGFMYESGLGVKRDLAHAEVLYRRAAKSGDLLSSYKFGFNYAGTNIP